MNPRYVDITGLDKAAVLAALHNAARSSGNGAVQDLRRDLTVDEGRRVLEKREILGRGQYDLDYMCGRPIKTDITEDFFNPALFDRDAGEGAAAKAIAALREPAL